MVNPTFIHYFTNADLVVKVVMLTLLAASVVSWAVILQRVAWLRLLITHGKQFVQRYHHSSDLGSLYRDLSKTSASPGIKSVFLSGYKEFSRAKQLGLEPTLIHESTQRAMQIAINQQVATAEQHLNFLATIGSISPYIGLFGTVWGIMHAFQALGQVQQASIAMVAPGISEALVATAMGLFAAIPAVVAYNRLTYQVDSLAVQWENFQAEFANLINRQVQIPV